MSLSLIPPDLTLWTDASDSGWDAHLGASFVSGLWTQEEFLLSINLRELMAVGLVLNRFASSVSCHSVAVCTDISTALTYLKNQGGTVSTSLNREAHDILRWAVGIMFVFFSSSSWGEGMLSRTLFRGGTKSSHRNGPLSRTWWIA